MKIFSYVSQIQTGVKFPDAIFSVAGISTSPATRVFTLRLPIPLWYDWEYHNYGAVWVFGLKWLQAHMVTMEGRPTKFQSRFHVRNPLRRVPRRSRR